MFYFYVLYSLKDEKLYKGVSANLLKRILQHNAGMTTSTKHRRPFILLYFECYDTKAQALDRERWAKPVQGEAALQQLLKKHPSPAIVQKFQSGDLGRRRVLGES
jgi:putative endonuclease